MNRSTPTLLELQHAIRHSLLQRADQNASAYVRADGLAAGERLGIYRNTASSVLATALQDRKSTRLNSSHIQKSRMPSSA